MYYELYIDVLFLENFMMDSLLLLLVRKIQKLPVKRVRTFLGAAIGAILTCMIFVLKIPIFVRGIIYILTTIVMVVIGLEQRHILEILRSGILLCGSAFLYGGLLYFFHTYIRRASLLYLIAISIYFVVDLFCEIFLDSIKEYKNVCKVTIFTTKGTFRLQALRDTGNRLVDPVTGDPVCVIGRKTAERILDLQSNLYDISKSTMEVWEQEKFRYIICKTITGESLMPIVRVKKMIIHAEYEKEVVGPLIGICAEPISERQLYQMILNSDIQGGTRNVSKKSSIATVPN